MTVIIMENGVIIIYDIAFAQAADPPLAPCRKKGKKFFFDDYFVIPVQGKKQKKPAGITERDIYKGNAPAGIQGRQIAVIEERFDRHGAAVCFEKWPVLIRS